MDSPNDGPRSNGLQFVVLTDRTTSKAWRKTVRSRAAREGHARTRRQRMLAYQASRASPLPDRDTAEDEGRGTVVVIPRPDPRGLLSAGHSDPFDSFARPTTTFEQFLLHHYIKYVVVNAALCDHFTDGALFRRGMSTTWVQLAATDAGMLCTLFLSAARSLEALHPPDSQYARAALAYRGAVMRAVRDAISDSTSEGPGSGRRLDDATIGMTLALASDSYLIGDLEVARRHVEAVGTMVHLKGGLAALGQEGFLRQLVVWFTSDPGLKSNAILERTCHVGV